MVSALWVRADTWVLSPQTLYDLANPGHADLLPFKEQRHSSGKDLTGSRTIGRITNASTDMVWPGDVAVTVDLITIKKEVLPRKGTQSAVLNDQVVYRPISSRLNLRPDNDPVKIEENKNVSQRGVNPCDPSQISMEMHRDLINNSTANNEVLKPWLSGDDINAQGVPTKFIVDVNHLELKRPRSIPYRERLPPRKRESETMN